MFDFSCSHIRCATMRNGDAANRHVCVCVCVQLSSEPIREFRAPPVRRPISSLPGPQQNRALRIAAATPCVQCLQCAPPTRAVQSGNRPLRTKEPPPLGDSIQAAGAVILRAPLRPPQRFAPSATTADFATRPHWPNSAESARIWSGIGPAFENTGSEWTDLSRYQPELFALANFWDPLRSDHKPSLCRRT